MDDLTDPELRADLVRRAMVAWYASVGRQAMDADQPASARPTPKRSAVEEIDGLTYVCLRTNTRLAACYRVRLVGGRAMLKRLKRLPDGVEGVGTDCLDAHRNTAPAGRR